MANFPSGTSKTTDEELKPGEILELETSAPQEGAHSMARCEVCGNDYDKAFTVTMEGSEHTFDSFECAIHALAKSCSHCGCRIIGHGIESGGSYYCCAHCAREMGVEEAQDRVEA